MQGFLSNNFEKLDFFAVFLLCLKAVFKECLPGTEPGPSAPLGLLIFSLFIEEYGKPDQAKLSSTQISWVFFCPAQSGLAELSSC